MTRPLSLAHLTLLDLSPPELIRVAGQAGFSSVGLRLIAVTESTPGYALMDDPRMMRETLDAMHETGVTVNDIEFVRLTPEFDPEALDPFLAAGAELGAKYIVTAPYDPDLARLTDNLAGFADRAAEFDLSPVLEFFPWTNVPDFRSALDIAAKTGNSAVGVLLDTLHFNRSGSDPDDISTADSGRLPFIHLCDAKVQPTYSQAELLQTARSARLIPGEGEIPLSQILSRLPANIPIALEVPSEQRDGANENSLAQQLWLRTQAFLDENGIVFKTF